MYINTYTKHGRDTAHPYHIFWVILGKSKILLNSFLTPISPSALYMRMLAAIVGVNAAKMSVIGISNGSPFMSILVSIIHKGIESPKTSRKNFNGEWLSGALLFMIVIK
jgi:hypothetical protein